MAPIFTNRPRLKRWVWFAGIYAGSVIGFGAIVGALSMLLPK